MTGMYRRSVALEQAAASPGDSFSGPQPGVQSTSFQVPRNAFVHRGLGARVEGDDLEIATVAPPGERDVLGARRRGVPAELDAPLYAGRRVRGSAADRWGLPLDANTR